MKTQGYQEQTVSKCIKKLSFKLPKGLLKKDILDSGKYPVISQSKDYIIGYSDNKELLVTKDLPLIIFGDHTKVVKYVELPFVIGADGVKIIKPVHSFLEKFFYYNLLGLTTYTKNYGRHYKLLKEEKIVLVQDKILQQNIVDFFDDLQNNMLKNKIYFNQECEKAILALQDSGKNIITLESEIISQQQLLKKLRQSILQEAIEGKLTKTWREQNPDIETGSVLIEKIKSEKEQLIKDKKLKVQKSLLPINKTEMLFDIPDSWEWCYLADYSINRDGDRMPVSKSERDRRKKTYDYYGASGIIDKIDGFTHEGTFLLIGEDGANLVARSTPIAFVASGKFWVNNHAHILEFLDLNSLKYIEKYINAIDLKTYITGGFQPKLSQANLNKIFLALPPLEEQKEIVRKIENNFKICDELERQINNSKTNSQALMQAVLKEAFENR